MPLITGEPIKSEDETSYEVREVFAHYGLAMYCAQLVERQLAMTLAILALPAGATAWDYDASIAEYFSQTFGTLVNTFEDIAGVKIPELTSRLKNAVERRNELAHHYFWDRAANFCDSKGCIELTDELKAYREELDAVDDDLAQLAYAALERRGMSAEELQQRADRLTEDILRGHATNWTPQRVPNPVRVISASVWRYSQSGIEKLVLLADDGRYLLPGERGLCYGPQSIPVGVAASLLDCGEAFPATINPRPKVSKPWFFGIALANGYVLRGYVRCEAGNMHFEVKIQDP